VNEHEGSATDRIQLQRSANEHTELSQQYKHPNDLFHYLQEAELSWQSVQLVGDSCHFVIVNYFRTKHLLLQVNA
jgi:hypothetical protein